MPPGQEAVVTQLPVTQPALLQTPIPPVPHTFPETHKNPWQGRCVPQAQSPHTPGPHLYHTSFATANAKLGLGKIRWRIKTKHRLIHLGAHHQLYAKFWCITCSCSPGPRTARCPSELPVGALARLKHSNTCQNAYGEPSAVDDFC